MQGPCLARGPTPTLPKREGEQIRYKDEHENEHPLQGPCLAPALKK